MVRETEWLWGRECPAAGSTQFNALARKHETRGLIPVEAAFCWRENRLAKVSFEQEI